MTTPVILVVSGPKQSGKGTLFGYVRALCEGAGRPVEEFSFAYRLKRFCVDVLGLAEEQAFGTNEQKERPVPHLLWENFPVEESRRVRNELGYVTAMRSGPMTGREVLQYWGSEVVRRFYPDAWPTATLKLIRESGIHRAGGVCVVTDGRFPNEIDIAASGGARTLRLTRRALPDAHVSEHALDEDVYDWRKFDLVLRNDAMTAAETCLAAAPVLTEWGVLPPLPDALLIDAAVRAAGGGRP